MGGGSLDCLLPVADRALSKTLLASRAEKKEGGVRSHTLRTLSPYQNGHHNNNCALEHKLDLDQLFNVRYCFCFPCWGLSVAVFQASQDWRDATLSCKRSHMPRWLSTIRSTAVSYYPHFFHESKINITPSLHFEASFSTCTVLDSDPHTVLLCLILRPYMNSVREEVVLFFMWRLLCYLIARFLPLTPNHCGTVCTSSPCMGVV